MAEAAGTITIEVACATPRLQTIVSLEVPIGTTARQAVAAAGLAGEFPDLDLDAAPLGIYGKPVADDAPLAAGDRVEVYRPLASDPRDKRRELAAQGQTIDRARD